MVWEAYKKVKANKGGAGVDDIDMVEYDVKRSKHLYKLWNRMASGSYFPPPVKEVEISKKDGGISLTRHPNNQRQGWTNGCKGIYRTSFRENIQSKLVWISSE
ncbi:MAG TPA: hypothetical protein VJ951_05175 [Bacteroidales bacterium]|nr:hypothetical protein [Bacteroidales bacterium]